MTKHAVPHGLAVVWGIDVVNHIAERRGLLLPQHRRVISDFIRQHFFDTSLPPLQAPDLLEGVRRDKKAAAGDITLAILREPGRLERIKISIDARLQTDLQDYLNGHNVFSKY